MDLKPNMKLKTKLYEKGITQRHLAFSINIHEARISRIIKGYEKPTGEIKEKISTYLNMSTEELFTV